MDLVYLIHKNNISLIFSLLKISFMNWVDSCFSSGPYPTAGPAAQGSPIRPRHVGSLCLGYYRPPRAARAL